MGAVMATFVMAALNIGVIHQDIVQQIPHRLVRIAAAAAVEPDACLRQGRLGAAANPAADQHIHPFVPQKSCQGPMSPAIGGLHLRRTNSLVLHLIELHLLRMAKMLKNFAVGRIIGHCNSHMKHSFGQNNLVPATYLA